MKKNLNQQIAKNKMKLFATAVALTFTSARGETLALPSPESWFQVENGVITDYFGPYDGDLEIPKTVNGQTVTAIEFAALGGWMEWLDWNHWLYVPSTVRQIGSEALPSIYTYSTLFLPSELYAYSDQNMGMGGTSTTRAKSYQVLTQNNPKVEEVMNNNSIGNVLKDISVLASIKPINGLFIQNGTVIHYEGRDKNVIIPAYVGGVPVTSIGTAAFAMNDYIETVILPDTITEIQESAFNYCQNLKEVQLSERLVTLGDFAFFRTQLLQVSLPNSLQYVGNHALSMIPAETIAFPNSVTYIGGNAVSDNENMTNVTFPDTLYDFVGYFDDCYKLQKLTIPEGVTTLTGGSLNAPNLKELTIPNSVNYISWAAFEDQGYYNDYDGSESDMLSVVPENLIIYCSSGSYGEYFAQKYNIRHIITS